MSLFQQIRQTKLGKWVQRQARRPLIGPLVRVGVRMVKWAERRLITLRPAHRAHDQRQEDILRRFEAPARTGQADAASARAKDAPAE